MEIILILVSILLNCLAQILMRKGMLLLGPIDSSVEIVSKFGQMLGNGWLWFSIFCYVMSLLIWLIVLSKVEVTFAYAFSSLGFIFVTIGGWLFLGEAVSLSRILGMATIFVGVLIVSQT